MTRLIERAFATALTKKIEGAVKAILVEEGMEPGKIRTTYGDLYKFAIEAVPVGAPKPEESNWQQLASLYGLPADGLGKTIVLSGKLFTITGLNTRARKSPVLLTEKATGKGYKAPIEIVNRALAVAK